MTQTRVIENQLRWSNDQNAAQSTIAVNKQIAGSLIPIREQADLAYEALIRQANAHQQNAAALGAVRQAADQAYAGRVAELTAEADAAATLAANTQRVADATDLVAKARLTIRDIGVQSQVELPLPGLGALPGESDGGGSTVAQKLASASRAAIALPGIGYQSPLVVGLRAASLTADKTGASFSQLAIAGGITAAAVVVVAVALNTFRENLDKSKTQLSGALSAQQNYYDALQNLTTQQVNDEIEKRRRATAILQQQADEANAALESSFKQSTTGIGGDISARINDALGDTPYKQLKEAADTANKALQENIQTETRLTQGRDAGAFAANDAAEAEKKLAKEREDAATQLIAQFDQEAQMRGQLAELRNTGADELANFFDEANHVRHDLTDQVNAQLDADRQRETLIRNFLLPALATEDQSLQTVKDKTQAYNTELTNLAKTDDLLVQAVLPVVQAREDELAALKADKDASDALNASLQDINKAQVDAASAAQKTAQAYTALQAVQTDHNANLLDIQDQYDTAQQSARHKLNDQLTKIDQQAAERRLEQRENDNLSIEQAVARGDIASAQYTLAQQRVRDQQQQRQIQQQKDDAQAAYEDQLTAARTQNDKLLKSEQERYTKEQQQRQQAYTQAFEEQQAADRRLASLRQQNAFEDQYWANVVTAAYDKIRLAGHSLADSMTADAQRMAQQASGASGGSTGNASGLIGQIGKLIGGGLALSATAQGYDYAAGKFPSSFTSTTPFGTPYHQGPLPPSFDEPSYNTRPGLYISRVPEVHIPAADFNRLSPRNNLVQISVDARGSGLNEDTLARKIGEVVRPLIANAQVEVVNGIAAQHASLKKGLGSK